MSTTGPSACVTSGFARSRNDGIDIWRVSLVVDAHELSAAGHASLDLRARARRGVSGHGGHRVVLISLKYYQSVF